MKLPFFVTGMPRSRTAWMAAWLTTDTSWCAHDTPLNCFPELPGERVGLSGPEVCVSYADFSASWPNAPWLVIERADALPAFKKVLDGYVDVNDNVLRGWWNERCQLLQTVIRGENTLTVDFYALDHPQTARRAWNHLLPERPFNIERWTILNNLRITQENWQRKAKTWPLGQ